MGMTWCQQKEPRRKCGIQEGDRDTYGSKSSVTVLVNQAERGEQILQIRNPGIGHKTAGEQTLGRALLLGLRGSLCPSGLFGQGHIGHWKHLM